MAQMYTVQFFCYAICTDQTVLETLRRNCIQHF